MKVVNKVQAMGLLLAETGNGRFFSVTFTKKDGSVRSMTCRRGVQKGLNGSGAKYNALSKALFTVYDVQKRDYRNINFQTIHSFKLGGSMYYVI